MQDRKKNPVECNKIKNDDLMAFVYYVKVKDVKNRGDLLNVVDLDNNNSPIRIEGHDLIVKAMSADQFAEEVKVTKTEAAETLVHSVNRPFTVSFQKSDDTERVLRGRLVKPEPLLGRSMCEDLDVSGKDRLRLVDHRSINWIIVDGVKYTVKNAHS